MIYRATFLLLFLILAADSATGQEIYEVRTGVYSTDTLLAFIEAKPAAEINIKSASGLSGSLNIVAAEANEVRVAYTKRAKADSRSQAIDFIDLISVNVVAKPTRIYVELRAPNPAPWSETAWSGRVEATVFVPYDCSIEVDASMFDVTARGPLKSLVIPESFGRLDIAGVAGKLDVAAVNRRITLSDIQGEIWATTTNQSLVAEGIVSRDGQARFRNEAGEIRIIDFEGALNAKNSLGRITIEDFRPGGQSSFIRSSSAPIVLEITSMTEGQLVINNRHEDIDITIPESISAFFALTVGEDGAIQASGFPFATEMVRHNRLNLISGEGAVDISGTIKGEGTIYIRGVKGE